MEIVEQTLGELEDLFNVIGKTYDNYKKAPKARLTRGYITVKLEAIEEYWKQFRLAHNLLMKNVKKEQRKLLPYFVQNQYFICEEVAMDAKSEMNDLLYAIESQSKQQHSSGQEVVNMSIAQQVTQVKLPRIEVPKFYGSYETWPTFQDLFTSLVHCNTSLTEVQKLHYLKTSVAGEAELLLRHIQVSEANYSHAWETLKRRYSNKRLIVTSLLKRIFNQRKLNAQNPNHIKSLVDTTSECLNSLKNQEIKTDYWDPLINFILVQKLDTETHKEWEEHVSSEFSDELPSFDTLKTFLETKFRTLELIQQPVSSRERLVKNYHISDATTEKMCPLCQEKHTLSHCKDFGKMEPEQRSEFAKSKHLCYNCLVPGHGVRACRLLTKCRLCHRRHHTLLHSKGTNDACGRAEKKVINQPKVFHSNVEEEKREEINLAVMTSQTNTARSSAVALLATALVECKSEDGLTTVLRALIDPGSQGCFISQRAAQAIRARRYPVKGSIVGVGEMKTRLKQVVQIEVLSRSEKFSLNVKAYVITKHLATQIPTQLITTTHWNHLDGLTLADPKFNQPSNIDLLLGVNEYAQIIQNDVVKGPPGSPSAQKTTLGWILFGRVSSCALKEEESVVVLHNNFEVEDMLKTLWEIDTETSRKLTREEEACERIYEETHTRTEEGRYIVKMPFQTQTPQSPEGNTQNIAMRRLEMLERRFERLPDLKRNYTEVMEEYIRLNHMQEIPKEEINKKSVYLPHHAVLKAEKETTKTRVVFDASCKGTNGVSLNDELMNGPLLQEDLRSIIMRWRTHKVCFVSDIEKMYRMVLINKDDIDFQRVLWRQNTSISDEVKHYRLLTVTFGTASAPYLAIKTLMQVSEDEGQNYPVAKKMICEDFYVDDLMSGCDTVDEAIEASRQLKIVLGRGKFRLQKWCSNNPEFLRSLDEGDRSVRAQLDINIDGVIKALGLSWNLGEDEFNYNLNFPAQSTDITKRDVLSDLQKLFDPLGWIAPAIIKAKIFVQRLWLHGVRWDDVLDDNLQTEWKSIRNDLRNVNDIKIPRWLNTLNGKKHLISLHGYSDASMHAMAAVVYCRAVQQDGSIVVNIIAARTKVAPIKTISVPRLELCAAVLLSKLIRQTAKAMRISFDNVFAYTDSTVVLAWLYGEPNRWKQFVANRVVEILDNLPASQWHHVQTDANPADVASRGTKLNELKQNELWWHGPYWLLEQNIPFSTRNIPSTEIEKRSIKLKVMNTLESNNKEILNYDNYSNLEELLKVIIYMRRFLKHKEWNEGIRAITTKEIDEATKLCIRKSQREDFEEEIEDIKNNRHVKKTSNLKSLNPYLDEEQILRVGGRLRHANLEKESKHPIILSNKNTLTSLIVADAHQKTMHGGVQLMLCHLRLRFWIIKAKHIVKRHIHRCIVCAKANAKTRSQIMGDLPHMRVNPSRAFLYSGVDFCGPFNVLMSKGRGAKTKKAYISIFICMCTKAMHLELVGDLTAEAFIAAFRRFVARRGRCAHMYSDQGRNFIGANRELVEAWKAAKLELKDEVLQTLALDGTQWHFIPPYSPNFGGLWEAGVKSVKSHLKKICTSNLTFEEMTTLLCQIESLLNSRPLTPIDEDVNNLNPLTPAHFLIGEPTIEVPTPDLTNLNLNHLDRWQHKQRLLQLFWQKWQMEYLTRLQQRPKWLRKQPEFVTNDIVLIKHDGLPPGKWLMGRIVAKHPGLDGATRVYSVKSGDSVTKRCVTKLCPLINVQDE